MSQFELFEFILLLKLDKQLPVEQFEATVSQSAVPSPPIHKRAASWRPEVPEGEVRGPPEEAGQGQTTNKNNNDNDNMYDNDNINNKK